MLLGPNEITGQRLDFLEKGWGELVEAGTPRARKKAIAPREKKENSKSDVLYVITVHR